MAWKKLKSKTVHKNPWFQVREDDVLMPNGNPGKFFVVETRGSASVIAEDENGSIYLVGQTRYIHNNNFSWEIITGSLKSGQTSLETAKAELEEEAGIVAEEWQEIGSFLPYNGVASEVTTLFLATKLKETKQNLDESEDIEVKKVSEATIREMIENNEISCGMTIAAFYKYLLYKNKKIYG